LAQADAHAPEEKSQATFQLRNIGLVHETKFDMNLM
jgi:hypothetical protein